MTSILPRHATAIALVKLRDARGIVVNGPRQCGKSELLRLIHAEMGGTLLTLDEPAALRAARLDPTGFVGDRVFPLLVDEVQRGGNPLEIGRAHV